MLCDFWKCIFRLSKRQKVNNYPEGKLDDVMKIGENWLSD